MTKETDAIWEKFLKDNNQPPAVIGETYVYKGVEYTYKENAQHVVEIVNTYPELIHKENCRRIINYEPPTTTQTIDENVRQYLIQALARNAATNGGTKPDIADLMAGAAAVGSVAGAVGNIAGAASAVGNIAGAVGNVAGAVGNIAGAASNLANLAGAAPILGQLASLPAVGLDKAMEAVKGQIKATEAKLPFKTGKASDITSKVNQVVKTVIAADVRGPASIIFSIIKSNLLKGIPEGGTSNPTGAGSRLADEAKKLVAAAPNKAAYEAQFKRMAVEFPEMNINNVALQAANMVRKGNPSAFSSAFPNMMKLAGGLLKLLGKPSKHPDKLPEPEKKTKPAPKPEPLVQPKNLFAAAAGASTMGTLMGTVSSLMGIVATVASNFNQMSPSPQLTSAGPQKLTGTANTATWGSGQFGKPAVPPEQIIIDKQMEMSTEIETLTAEILSECDLEKITSKSMEEIMVIYPQYNESTTVLELLVAINEYEKKQSSITA